MNNEGAVSRRDHKTRAPPAHGTPSPRGPRPARSHATSSEVVATINAGSRSQSSNASGFCLCGLSRSSVGCAVRRCDLEGESHSAPSTLGVAVARVGCAGKAVGRAVSGWSTSIEVRGAARSPPCVRPPPHALVARRQLVCMLRRRRARSHWPLVARDVDFGLFSARACSRS